MADEFEIRVLGQNARKAFHAGAVVFVLGIGTAYYSLVLAVPVVWIGAVLLLIAAGIEMKRLAEYRRLRRSELANE